MGWRCYEGREGGGGVLKGVVMLDFFSFLKQVVWPVFYLHKTTREHMFWNMFSAESNITLVENINT